MYTMLVKKVFRIRKSLFRIWNPYKINSKSAGIRRV